jgi:hypothetical protein
MGCQGLLCPAVLSDMPMKDNSRREKVLQRGFEKHTPLCLGESCLGVAPLVGRLGNLDRVPLSLFRAHTWNHVRHPGAPLHSTFKLSFVHITKILQLSHVCLGRANRLQHAKIASPVYVVPQSM